MSIWPVTFVPPRLAIRSPFQSVAGDRENKQRPATRWRTISHGPRKEISSLSGSLRALGFLGAAHAARRRVGRAVGASKDEKEAMVVGAGPCGLAAALMLAKRGWKVSVFERSSDPAAYDPGKGFMYLIDGRGQKCLRDLSHKLFERLVASAVAMADAKIGVLTPKGLTERVNPIKDADRKSYWIPRHAFVGFLLEEAQKCENIKIYLEADIQHIASDASGFHIKIGSGQETRTHDAPFLLGADGYRSAVREKLEEWDGKKGRFLVRKFTSPSAGLRYKVLTLPGEFELETPEGRKAFLSEGFYAIRGVSEKNCRQKLGLIPVSREFGTRTANLITYEDDVVWEADTAESFKAYASEQWPHFPIESLVSEKEITRFAENRGGRFPSPQFCPTAVWSNQGGTAVLLGDALHSLPPDIGQGVNSALEDVTVLAACLNSTEALNDAATQFEKHRMPDVKALIKIVRVAAPFQYSQAPWRGRLWNISFLCRLLLNKALPRVYDLPLFLLIQRSEMSYREVWKKGTRGARRAIALGIFALYLCGFEIVQLFRWVARFISIQKSFVMFVPRVSRLA